MKYLAFLDFAHAVNNFSLLIYSIYLKAGVGAGSKNRFRLQPKTPAPATLVDTMTDENKKYDVLIRLLLYSYSPYYFSFVS